jgi:hypothetical protein
VPLEEPERYLAQKYQQFVAESGSPRTSSNAQSMFRKQETPGKSKNLSKSMVMTAKVHPRVSKHFGDSTMMDVEKLVIQNIKNAEATVAEN